MRSLNRLDIIAELIEAAVQWMFVFVLLTRPDVSMHVALPVCVAVFCINTTLSDPLTHTHTHLDPISSIGARRHHLPAMTAASV